MPAYRITQIISHPEIPNKIEKTSHIIGRDLKHAVECVRTPYAHMKRELHQKFWSRHQEPGGRIIYIEIEEDLSERPENRD